MVLAVTLTGPTGRRQGAGGVFQPSDQVAMVVLGVLVARASCSSPGPRSPPTHRVRIRNIIGGYDLPWEVVRAVRFDRGNPWASLELHDDDVVAVMALQAADKEHAVDRRCARCGPCSPSLAARPPRPVR